MLQSVAVTSVLLAAFGQQSLPTIPPSPQQDEPMAHVVGAAKASRELEARKMARIVTRMESPDRGVRKAAFQQLWDLLYTGERHDYSGAEDALNSYFIRNPEQAEEIRVGLIHLLTIENARTQQLSATALKSVAAPTPEPDAAEVEGGEDDFYPAVIGMVAELNDERAIPALVGAMPTGGLAESGLLKYGMKALGPVLEQLNSPDPLMHSEALATGITILLKLNDASSAAKINTLIQSGLRDGAFVVRMAAIQGIERLDDGTAFVPQLQDLAGHDPLVIPAKDGGGGDVYPVRKAAQSALEKIAGRSGQGTATSSQSQ